MICDIIKWIASGYENSEEIKVKFGTLSQIVYKTTAKEREEELKKKKLDKDFKLVRVHSNRDVAVFIDIKCDKLIIAFRGTDIQNLTSNKRRDLQTDLFIVIGQFKRSKRFKDAENTLKEMIKRHGKSGIVLTGHSLGGAIAYDLSIKYDLPAIVYNKGTSPLKLAKNTRSVQFNTNNSKVDLLSVATFGEDNIIIDTDVKPGLGSHTIDNFV
jgi:hypothetical protein